MAGLVLRKMKTTRMIWKVKIKVKEKGPVCRGLCTWAQLGSWDRTAMLDTEISYQVLTLANQGMEEYRLMEWPQATHQDENKYIRQWAF